MGRYFMFFIAITALVFSCGKDKTINIQENGSENELPDEPPLAPTNLIGEALSSSVVQLNWVDNSDNETGFIIYRKHLSTWGQIAVMPENALSHTDSLLQDSTTYYYFVVAVNAEGSSPPSDSISITTFSLGSAPETPVLLYPQYDATIPGQEVFLNWRCSDPDGDPLTYDVYFGTISPPPLVDSSSNQSIYYPDPEQIQGMTTYYWKIIAKDNQRHQTESSERSFNALYTVNLVGSYYHDGMRANDVFVVEDYAHIADYFSELIILDISIPENPTEAGYIYVGHGNPYNLFVDGIYAYLASSSFGLTIVDISDPTYPTMTGELETAGYAYNVFVSGQFAYLADGYGMHGGLRIINIADPENPALTGSYNIPGQTFAIFVSGNYAYVAGGDAGLQVIDIASPANPTLVGSYDDMDGARDVYVVGNYAFVTDYDSGLKVIDISNPANPTLVGDYFRNGFVGLHIVDNYAYIANGSLGVKILDVSQPTDPILVGEYDTGGEARNIFAINSYIYVAAQSSTLYILQFSP